MPDAVTVDQWTPLTHKAPLADHATGGILDGWVPEEDRRRLTAYYVLDLYRSNAARHILANTARRSDHREYGDVDLAIRRTVAAVLGDGWTITVDGAEDPDPAPRIPAEPDDADLAALPAELQAQVTTVRTAMWRARVEAEVERWTAAAANAPALAARQHALQAWAERRQFAQTLDAGERDAVGLGDTIYVAWPEHGDWPTISAHGPDGYFPLLADNLRDGFPTGRLDLAWTFTEPDPDTGLPESFLRRCTWELVDLNEVHTTRTREGLRTRLVWADHTGQPANGPTLRSGETIIDGVQVARKYPWHVEGDEPSTTTCVYTEIVWAERDLEGRRLRDLDEGKATRVIHDRTDLGIDTIPVVHVPNTPAAATTWGTASVTNGAQVIDDVATNDTDAMQASRYLSDPTIFLSGATPDTDVVTPGTMLSSIDPAGKMTVLDLSGGLEKLREHGADLQDRWWQTIGIPAEILGRVDNNGGELSGVALALRLAPFAQIIANLRMAREPKYQLLLKIVQRMAQAAGALDPGPTPTARLAFGSFLPTNRAETVTMVAQALQAHAISTQTAVNLLVAAGFPIDDAAEELERIRAENPATYEAASHIADATASEASARAWLEGQGIDLGDDTTPPPVDLP